MGPFIPRGAAHLTIPPTFQVIRRPVVRFRGFGAHLRPVRVHKKQADRESGQKAAQKVGNDHHSLTSIQAVAQPGHHLQPVAERQHERQVFRALHLVAAERLS